MRVYDRWSFKRKIDLIFIGNVFIFIYVNKLLICDQNINMRRNAIYMQRQG